MLVSQETKELLSCHVISFFRNKLTRDMTQIDKKLTEVKAPNEIRQIYLKSQATGNWLRGKFKLL